VCLIRVGAKLCWKVDLEVKVETPLFKQSLQKHKGLVSQTWNLRAYIKPGLALSSNRTFK